MCGIWKDQVSQNRLKVLQLQNYYNVNASDLAEQIIKSLPVERFEVTTAFLSGRPAAGQAVSGAEKTHYFDFARHQMGGVRLVVLWRLFRHIRNEGYDVIIAHRFKPLSLILWVNLLLKLKLCIGVVHGIGDYDRPSRQWLFRHIAKPNCCYVAVSQAVRSYLLALDSAFTPTNTLCINNAIDIPRAEKLQREREEARQLLGMPRAGFVFGSIGRLVPVKGHVDLIAAFAKLAPHLPGACVAIIGEGRERPVLEAAIRGYQLEGRVLLLGARDDALQYIRAFDAFVMPSRSEGLPLALLEAMSGRLPIIGTDIPSMRPLLEGAQARLYSPGQIDVLAEHMNAVFSAPTATREAEGERAYSYLCREHDIDDFRSHYLALLGEIWNDDD
ncbi:glycosyltransferase [Pseudomonas sp. 57B-090624]|nr:glycosyltransferase [Pseudomonas sp. 57B-090624]